MGETLYNDTIYVAVNQDVRESKSTLLWTLRNFHVKKLCLLHVHIPFSLTASSSGLEESEIDAIQESIVKTAYDSLHKYRDICTNKGVKEEDVDISWFSGYGVGEGIVELIYQNNITKLVMGAAADPHYSRGMSITSRKAEYVSQHAPHSCKMWFICKGKLIKTKEGSFDLGYPSDSFSEFSASDQKPSRGRRREEHETKPPKEHSGTVLETEEASKRVRKEEPEKNKSNGNKVDSDKPHPDFKCPISLEIMRDPHIAADGHTYEAKEIGAWFRGGHQTSPKTGARLANHNLTPNYTLRSIINDWLLHHPNHNTD
ncbi:unnamed protein product [Arabis nemorensis]|uniref:RING-type E3 ubiquitin transferase n=1 Tax=Arabis nemorensis TaxID=586526 RepID=A0A565AM78_9BRAS|nr:unnamed protein product [Arabis nemorensis]